MRNKFVTRNPLRSSDNISWSGFDAETEAMLTKAAQILKEAGG